MISEFGLRGIVFILKSDDFITVKQKLLCAYLLKCILRRLVFKTLLS